MDDDDSVSTVASNALRNSIESAGGVVTSYIGLVNYLDDEGGQCWALLASPETTVATDLGNAAFLTKLVERWIEQAIDSQS